MKALGREGHGDGVMAMLLKGILAGTLVGSVLVAPIPALGSGGTDKSPQQLVQTPAAHSPAAEAAAAAAVKKAKKNRIVVKVRGRRLGGKATIRIRGVKGRAKGVKKTVRVKKRKTVKPLPRGKYKIKAKKITARGRTARPTPKKQKVRLTRKHGAKATFRYRLVAQPTAPPDLTPPGPVTNLRVAALTYSSVTLAWTNPDDADLAEIIVRRAVYAPPPASPTEGSGVRMLESPTASGLTDDLLSPQVPYAYAIFTRDSSGNTSPTAATVMVTTPPAPWMAVEMAAGVAHTCARRANGKVVCWGSNEYGQLGDGTTIDSPAGVAVIGVTGAVAIAAGNDHTCAVVAGGAVRCWGRNQAGQLGDVSRGDGPRALEPAVPGVVGATAIAAGYTHTCALLDNGTVSCWGTEGGGDGPATVAGLSDATAITAGPLHTCALLASGAVKCWGYNVNGELGDGTTAHRDDPVAVVGVKNATAVAAGTSYRDEGDPWHSHSCALMASGSVQCWGYNGDGQLGDGTTEDRSTPVPVTGIADAKAVAAGMGHSCAVMAGVPNLIKCWGSGALGNGTLHRRSAPVTVAEIGRFGAITAGAGHSCVLRPSYTPACWGDNTFGQLGDGTTTTRTTPTRSVARDLTAQGHRHSCSRVDLGRVTCVGFNDAGQLGDGTTRSRWTTNPAPGSGLVTGLIGAKSLTAADHTCALLLDGTATCWGPNQHGQLGDGTTEDRHTPVTTTGVTGATAIAAGDAHTCAIANGGAVQCWGANSNGQLGDGTTEDRHTPVTTTGVTGATAIAAGDAHTCAIATGGAVQCWGANSNGQLGDGSTTDRSIPGPTPGIAEASDLAAGRAHTCAVARGGQQLASVSCWGSNRNGQLGDGTTTDRSTPARVIGSGGAESVSAGGNQSCAQAAWGTPTVPGGEPTLGVKCWGDNSWGQLGINPGWLPVTVEGL